MNSNRKEKITFKHKVEYSLIKAGEIIFPKISVYHRKMIAIFIGYIMYYLLPIRKEMALRNCQLAFRELSPDKVRSLVKRVYIHYAFMMIDAFAIYKMTGEEFSRRVINKNPEMVDNALGEKKGCIITTAHFGSWEAFGAWFPFNGYKFAAILKKQKNPLAHRHFYETRTRTGMKLILTTAPSSELLSYLKKGYLIGIVSDQNAGKRGVMIPFFGKEASTPVGTAVYALRKNIPIVAGLAYLDEQCRYHIVQKRIDYSDLAGINDENIREITLRYTRFFEKIIKQHPEQYFWFHNRWKIGKRA